ncbi:MAG: hypothetical protein OQK00_02460 [Rhodobacteraceae bacterium]|nr:hypothetical protein [Paracoccaceae bacterium]
MAVSSTSDGTRAVFPHQFHLAALAAQAYNAAMTRYFAIIIRITCPAL